MSTRSQIGAPINHAYENQLLGAFIYALGYESGRTGKPIPVNLFQQTPLDGSFGDLVAGADWCVAFEFKRSWQAAKSERDKWPAANLQHYLQDARMQDIARRAHFLCFGARDQGQVTLGTLRYAAFLRDPELSKDQATRGTALVDILVNCTGLKRADAPIGVEPNVLEAYLRCLYTMRKVVGGGERPAEWLTVVSTSDGYRIRSANSLEQLLDMPKARFAHRSIEVVRSHQERQNSGHER